MIAESASDGSLVPATRNAITAAGKLGGEVFVLVAGKKPEALAKLVAQVNGVKRVVVASDEALDHQLPGSPLTLFNWNMSRTDEQIGLGRS